MAIAERSMPFRVSVTTRVVTFPMDQIWMDNVTESQLAVVLVTALEEISIKGNQLNPQGVE